MVGIILEIDGVEFRYNSIEALKGVTFKVNAGEIVAILGPNGSGKSTLLRCIAKVLKPKKGVILVEGKNVSEMKPAEVAKIVGYVPQTFNINYITVFDALLLGRKPHIKWDVTKKDLEIVSKVIKLVGLEDYALRYLTELSGGELQKVIIGRALVQEPRVLLLDEPTSNLDPKNQVEIMKIIRSVSKSRDIATILVMHDLNLALKFADRFVMMNSGMIYAEGGKEIVNEENIRKIYGIDVEVIDYNGQPIIIPKI